MVQMVEVIFWVTVEVMISVWITWWPADVMVCFTVKVVTYSVTISVVTTSWVVWGASVIVKTACTLVWGRAGQFVTSGPELVMVAMSVS